MKKGSFLAFPGEITHLYNITPLHSGELTLFSTKVSKSCTGATEIHGEFHCPGYEKDENMEDMRNLLNYNKMFELPK